MTVAGHGGNAALFVSNLRLLDLDKLADWPDISASVLDARDVLSNQKRRIVSTEWALFRLFQLHDADTALNKLQPFFPPLEPVQSLNLRAALYRCLGELKKSGQLGRHVVLRKTMLDECKGDKFEEMLVAFSALVLRQRTVASTAPGTRSIARSLSAATTLSGPDRALLPALCLAHRISLARRLDEKRERVNLYRDISDAMNAKAMLLAAEAETLSNDAASPRDETEPADIAREVQSHLSNDVHHAVLYGGIKDGPVESYDDAIADFLDESTIAVQSETTSALLDRMGDFLHKQERRLEIYKSLRAHLPEPQLRPELCSTKTSYLRFSAHLKPGTDDATNAEAVQVSDPYFDIVSTLRTNIEAITRGDTKSEDDQNNGPLPPPTPRLAPPSIAQSFFSPVRTDYRATNPPDAVMKPHTSTANPPALITLAERTRLSMLHGSQRRPEKAQPPTKRLNSEKPPPPESMSLAERTKQSMSIAGTFTPAPAPPAEVGKARPRTVPAPAPASAPAEAVQTPVKQAAKPDGRWDNVPDDASYEAIFTSRSRIRRSPPLQDDKHDDGTGAAGDD